MAVLSDGDIKYIPYLHKIYITTRRVREMSRDDN